MKFHSLFIFFFFVYGFTYSQQDTKLKLSCKEIEKKNEENLENIIVKTCYLKKYKFVSIGSPDYKGRYFWEYQVFKLINKKYIRTNNSDIFKNPKQLENYVNNQIKKSYESDKEVEELKECVSHIKFRAFALNEMGIDFDEQNNITFHTSFDLSTACLNVDRNIIPMSLDKIKQYLK